MNQLASFHFTETKSTQLLLPGALFPSLTATECTVSTPFLFDSDLVATEKLTRQMSSTDNVLRTKILREINEEFHQGDKLNAALDNSDILEELIKCFVEDDATIRELASRAVIKVAGTEKGRSMLAMPMLNEED